MTKYPSILTYHELGDKGRLKPELITEFNGEIFLTEKVDGTNSRLIVFPDKGSYFIGSREEILHFSTDCVFNPTLNIVETMKGMADRVSAQILNEQIFHDSNQLPIAVLYFETYGGKINKSSKQYSSDKTLYSFRLFDIVLFDVPTIENVLGMDLIRISSWRENGNQNFVGVSALKHYSKLLDLELVPYIDSIDGTTLPTDILAMNEFLKEHIPATLVGIQETNGKSEGIVLRNADRSKIAKVRFSDLLTYASPP